METQYTTYSRMQTHRSCPQKYQYSYIRRLEEDTTGAPAVERDFGNWWHLIRAADAIRRGAQKGSLKWVPEELKAGDEWSLPVPPLEDLLSDGQSAATLWLEAWEMLGKFDESLTSEEREAWVERIGGGPRERLVYVEVTWQNRWEDQMEHEAPVAVEYHWERALPGLTLGDGSPWSAEIMDAETILTGYIDELYLDQRRGVMVVRDHKSHKSLQAVGLVDDMLESQLQLYAWGAAPAVKEWGLPSIKMTAYDRVRMTAPKTPVLTKSGALSKSVTDYDERTYSSWAGEGVEFPGLKKDGSGAGTYHFEESVMERLRDEKELEKWTSRTIRPLNRNVVVSHLRAAVDEARELRITTKRAEETGEAPRNMTTFGCRWCPFAELCKAEMVGGARGEYDLQSMKLRKKAPSSEIR